MKWRRARWLAMLILAASWAVIAKPAQAAGTSLDEAVNSLFGVHEFDGVALSPDGRRVAWVERQQGSNGEPSSGTRIYVLDLAVNTSHPVRITAGDGSDYSEDSPAWSPDSRHLAFLSDAAGAGESQLYVADAASASCRKLTDLRGDLSDPAWSPDGKRLAFLFIENAPRAPGPLEPMTPLSGVVEEHIYEQRVATVDVASGNVKQVSPADEYVYEYDWSPDSRAFAATAAEGLGDANWWVAHLERIDAATGQTKLLLKPEFQMCVPRWSPDGKTVAFIGGVMSDAGSNGGDIYTIPASGGEARDVTPGIKTSPAWLCWPSSQRILFSANADGDTGFFNLDLASGAVEKIWQEGEGVTSGGWGVNASFANDFETSAVVKQSFSAPPEVWAGRTGAWRQLTHVNANATREWGKAESIHWENGGERVQGWLLYPLHYDPSQRYPLVVEVHGGPSSAAKPHWPVPFFDLSIMSHEGYFVLFPNPRGSYGQGEAFAKANIKDFGYGDFHDILAGADYVAQDFPVDPHRMGISGWSYGGYMTMWAVTQTDRFRAAVAGAGIANWQSYYGENDISTWMLPFFGASVYDDPAIYARSSPIAFIKKVKTPTLILVGDSDGECPMPQSEEFYEALKTLGVKTQFVVYPHEGHNIHKPEDRRDIVHRMVDWFNSNM
jgi:dipeptidyl aminopeptidase/acylaminoacyl peptidase